VVRNLTGYQVEPEATISSLVALGASPTKGLAMPLLPTGMHRLISSKSVAVAVNTLLSVVTLVVAVLLSTREFTLALI
jgi:hypothetical protein